MTYRIAHLITDLKNGGAQTMLYKMLSGLNKTQYHSTVLSLTTTDPIGDKIQALGVSVIELGMRPNSLNPLPIIRLIRLFKALRINLIHTWMYHADLIGALAGFACHKTPVIWGIHHGELSPETTKRGTILLANLNARLSSRLPREIVYVSDHARDIHHSIGYCNKRDQVIFNGVDLTDFYPNIESRYHIRSELGLASKTPLIGMIARFHPLKDYQTFIKAAGLIHQIKPDVHFLLCGDDVNADNRTMMEWIQAADITQVVHTLGHRKDVAHIIQSLDIATSTSRCESFSLVMAEAMACGVPCVTTDIPGPVSVVGPLGWIVPVGNPKALCNVWIKILHLTSEQRHEYAHAAQERVKTCFSIETMIRGYELLYKEILKN